MRRLAPVLVVIALAIAGFWLWKSRAGGGDAAAPASGSASGSAGGVTTAGAAPKAPAHAQRITPEERKQLDARLEAAKRARANAPHSIPKAPSLPAGSGEGGGDIETIEQTTLDAMKEAIPFLAACYTQHGTPEAKRDGVTAVAMMTLTTDPDIGTVIDADQIFDDKNQPLNKPLDDCLRNTMQTLELPPLKDGQTARIQYSFRFEDDHK